MAVDFIDKKEFLQSEEWMNFQEKTGKETFHVENGRFSANVIGHTLPIVGNYFYVPRGPVIGSVDHESRIKDFFGELIWLAAKNKAGWIRFDPESEKVLELMKKITSHVVKAPHDMQPKEIFVIDIAKSEEELLLEMKPKTRYNVNLAKKKGVKIAVSDKEQKKNGRYIEEFIKLVDLTANRKGIRFHPGAYYRKMIESIPGSMLKLYCAEYNNKIVAANLVVFYGKTAIYLHGATDDECRNVMAPYLLQWQAILDAKKVGCEKYDFGGVKIDKNKKDPRKNSWGGITKFKLGFSQIAKPIEFPGSYDIIINKAQYFIYGIIVKIKKILS